MRRSDESWASLVRRFLAAECGGAGLEYVLFAACWGAAVSGGLYWTTSMMTAKFDAVSAALKGHIGALR